MKKEINQAEATAFVKKMVLEAGEILKKYWNSGAYTKRQKDGVDFTTQADCEVDAFLRKKISERYPISNFLTEETAPDDYSSLKNAENLWVIDPLDGTINFSRKNTNFAISTALMHKGEIQIGIVYVPLEDKLYYAEADKDGAFLNEEKVSVSQTASLRECIVACDWAWDLKKRKNVVKWLDVLVGHIRQVKSMGSAAADLASLAAGRIDIYIHSGLKPWDVAAAGLIVEKAGGIINLPDGSHWSPFDSEILAGNKVLSTEILRLIYKEEIIKR